MGDSTDHGIRVLRERNWRNSALNREEWRKILKKAWLMQGCRANDDDDDDDGILGSIKYCS
jgi:hypothetical protein